MCACRRGRAWHCATAPDPQVSHRNLAQESRQPVSLAVRASTVNAAISDLIVLETKFRNSELINQKKVKHWEQLNGLLPNKNDNGREHLSPVHV